MLTKLWIKPFLCWQLSSLQMLLETHSLAFLCHEQTNSVRYGKLLVSNVYIGLCTIWYDRCHNSNIYFKCKGRLNHRNSNFRYNLSSVWIRHKTVASVSVYQIPGCWLSYTIMKIAESNRWVDFRRCILPSHIKLFSIVLYNKHISASW